MKEVKHGTHAGFQWHVKQRKKEPEGQKTPICAPCQKAQAEYMQDYRLRKAPVEQRPKARKPAAPKNPSTPKAKPKTRTQRRREILTEVVGTKVERQLIAWGGSDDHTLSRLEWEKARGYDPELGRYVA